MFNGSIRNLRSSSNFRSFTTAISMQSATSSRRHNRRHLTKWSGSDQGFIADGGRQMASMATAVAPSPQHIIKELNDSAPTQKQGRHFTDKKFADAPISLASKKAIHHEWFILNRCIVPFVLNRFLGLCPMFKVRTFLKYFLVINWNFFFQLAATLDVT